MSFNQYGSDQSSLTISFCEVKGIPSTVPRIGTRKEIAGRAIGRVRVRPKRQGCVPASECASQNWCGEAFSCGLDASKPLLSGDAFSETGSIHPVKESAASFTASILSFHKPHSLITWEAFLYTSENFNSPKMASFSTTKSAS